MSEETKPKLKFQTWRVVTVQDWDVFIEQVYGKPYSFQQQDGCKERGMECIRIPSDDHSHFVSEPFDPNTHDEDIQCVPFDVWLARDPKQPYEGQETPFDLELWWTRQFYPCTIQLVDDLLKRGLLEEGEIHIEIDW